MSHTTIDNSHHNKNEGRLENVAQGLHLDLTIYPYTKLFQLPFLEINLQIHYYRRVQRQNIPNFLLFETITVSLK